MGGYSTIHCNYEKRNRESHVKQYSEPKNKFERALSDKSGQSIQSYRVKLLQSGLASKARGVGGKTVLTLRHVVKRP